MKSFSKTNKYSKMSAINNNIYEYGVLFRFYLIV